MMHLGFLGMMAIPLIAMANEPPAEYRRIADRHGVPADVLYAVARTESGRTLAVGQRAWPWTLNIAGRGHFYASRAQACGALRSALTRTSLIDVGIAQLNVRWNSDLFGPGGRFAEPCDALNPSENLDAAAALLRRHYDRTNNWISAAGRYHRPAGGYPAAKYSEIVASKLSNNNYPPTTKSTLTNSSESLLWIQPTKITWFSGG